MIEVEVNSIRVSLMNQQRVVLLKDINADRYLPIWIGQFEADAITIELQEKKQFQRPLTHDLLKSVIEQLNGRVVHIYINDMRREVFYARLVVDVNGEQIEIDSRPSDAIALAVRAKAPIFVSEAVMDKNSVEPEEDVSLDAAPSPFGSRFSRSGESGEASDKPLDDTMAKEDKVESVDESQFSAFADFVNSLDLDLDERDDDDN